jgi:hypothetical protein
MNNDCHLGVLLAACLMVPVSGAAAAAQPDPDYAKGVVTTEARDMTALVDALDRYERRVVTLEKAVQPATTDLDALQSDGDAVKRATASYQRALSGVIAKLRSAGKWTPEFDAYVETKAKADPELLQALRKLGGARSAMERASGAIGGLPRLVDDDLRALRAKGIARQLLEQLTGTPVAATARQDGCIIRYIASTLCRIGPDGTCVSTKCYMPIM